MKKIILVFSLLVGSIIGLNAQTAREEINEDIHRSASNYYAYPNPGKPQLTAAPNGYKPFYISAYARHGSRFLINPESYSKPLEVLQQANSAGKLTTLGKQVLVMVDSITRMSQDRLGELTPVGAEQHQGIAERMFRNFPEVFDGAANIDARSTIVIRCILSMLNECSELKALNPDLKIKTDASEHDMYYMNYDAKDIRKLRELPDVKEAMENFQKQHQPNPDRLMNLLFNDPNYVKDNVDRNKFMKHLFELASNMQSHKYQTNMDLYSIFTKDECYDFWQIANFYWYVNYGASPLTKGQMPYMEANLLKNILDTADSCVTSKKNQATLRFGHDTCVLPLEALMELGDCGVVVNNPEELADKWRTYKIVGMADNVQFVFYRKDGNRDILVKALLNEKEVTMPVKTDIAPYYHWKDVEAFYRNKLAKFASKN